MNLIRSIQWQSIIKEALVASVVIAIAGMLGLYLAVSDQHLPPSPPSYVAVNISKHDGAVLKIGEPGLEGKDGNSNDASPITRPITLLSEDGNHIWTRDIKQNISGSFGRGGALPGITITGEGRHWINEVLPFKDGDMLVTGVWIKSLSVNGTPVAHQPPHFSLLGESYPGSVFLLKFDGQRKLVWSKTIGPLRFGSEGNFMTVITDADTILLASTFKGSLQITDSRGNEVVLTNKGKAGLLTAEIDPSSGLLWIEEIGGGWIWLRTLEAFPEEEYIVGGSFGHGVWFERKNGEVMSFSDDEGTFFALASFGGNS